MICSEVAFGPFRYPFYRGTNCLDEVVARLLETQADRYIVVSDAIVAAQHGAALMEHLGARAAASLHLVAIGESGKNLESVGGLLQELLGSGATRRSCVVAFGGGVVGNMAGLAASLAFRGVRLVHLPTSLVALVDSVLSLKQAVNVPVGKNLIGAFHCPTAVIADTAWLATLPERERRSGLAEMVKTAIAIDPQMLPGLREMLRPDCHLNDAQLLQLVEWAIAAKQRVMIDDAHERQEGLALEYGHTVGHAVELSSQGELSHGEAIGLGMLCAARLGSRVCGLSEADVAMHHLLLGSIGVTPALLKPAVAERAAELLAFDNKRGYLAGGRDLLGMVLLARLGAPARTPAGILTPVPLADAAASLRWLVESAPGGRPADAARAIHGS